MLKNYLKITWKVLMRNKMFTAISLFGICFTLTILLVAASFYDFYTKPNYPARKGDNLTFLHQIKIYGQKLGKNRYNNAYTGEASYYLLDRCVRTLQTPQNISVFSSFQEKVDGFVNNERIELKIKYTDAAFWEILDFKFIEGRSYNSKEDKESQSIAVINRTLAEKYFGAPNKAIGKQLKAEQHTFTIIGVVEDAPGSSFFYYANIWVPNGTFPSNLQHRTLKGDFMAVLQLNKANDKKQANQELQTQLNKLEFPYGKYNYIETQLSDTIESFFRSSAMFKLLFYLLILIFILIPSLNLVNINLTRFQERMSEIGIRKSFGAHKNLLVGQFITENIVLTFIGGILAFIVSYFILKSLQPLDILPKYGFILNIRILIAGVGLCFLFGFISGVLPAYRMAKLQIITSLKDGEK